jgi:hypothetical protein
VPTLHNKYHGTAPIDAVYIGRGSAFGNPFVIGKDGDRDEVCDKYEKMVRSDPDLIRKIRDELEGKDLICFCAPKRCHGDLLLKIANEEVHPVAPEDQEDEDTANGACLREMLEDCVSVVATNGTLVLTFKKGTEQTGKDLEEVMNHIRATNELREK